MVAKTLRPLILLCSIHCLSVFSYTAVDLMNNSYLGSKLECDINYPNDVKINLPYLSRSTTKQIYNQFNSSTPKFLKSFSNFEIFLDQDHTPQSRGERGKFFLGSDLLHQLGVQILINKKEIKTNTLVLSDTGHDIAIAAQVLKNKTLNAFASFHFPSTLRSDWANNMRLTTQAQDWGELIKERNSKFMLNKEKVIFLGLEGHRSNGSIGDNSSEYLYEIDISSFPTQQQLNELGIDNIVYLYERNPSDSDVERLVLKDIKKYLNTLSLPINYLGADCRRSLK